MQVVTTGCCLLNRICARFACPSHPENRDTLRKLILGSVLMVALPLATFYGVLALCPSRKLDVSALVFCSSEATPTISRLRATVCVCSGQYSVCTIKRHNSWLPASPLCSPFKWWPSRGLRQLSTRKKSLQTPISTSCLQRCRYGHADFSLRLCRQENGCHSPNALHCLFEHCVIHGR